jgi:hypothetical protein
MINSLMRNPTIILQNIIIRRPRRSNQFLNHRQYLHERVVRDIGKLCAVVFGYYQLYKHNAISLSLFVV